MDEKALKTLIRDIPDFPEPGVVFKDITPLLGDAAALRAVVEGLATPYADRDIHKVVGIEARGFILAAPVAHELHAGFVPVRKPGKLPHDVEEEDYELEYGTDLIEIHRDALHPGDRVLVVDDVIATGGTAAAAVRLLDRLGAVVVAVGVLVELDFLNGRGALPDIELRALVNYDGSG